MRYRIEPGDIIAAGTSAGYRLIDFQETIGMISFAKKDVRINVYLSKMTVATCLTHPKRGATQLFRKNVDLKMMKEIFRNPRIHTGEGYYQNQ